MEWRVSEKYGTRQLFLEGKPDSMFSSSVN